MELVLSCTKQKHCIQWLAGIDSAVQPMKREISSFRPANTSFFSFYSDTIKGYRTLAEALLLSTFFFSE